MPQAWTFREVLAGHVARQPERPFLIAPETGRVLSYGEIDRQARLLASYLSACGLKKGSNLSMRLTLFAPPVASREYALGLATKASETLRRHLRGLGVPPRKIIRVVIDPRRATVAADERIHVEVRLIGDK